MLRAFLKACETPWAITPAALQMILDVSTREHLPDFEAVAAKRSKRLDASDSVRLREGGIAVISVAGPIFRYADFFTEISGGASVDSLARDFNQAIDDPNIGSILLNVDSPGGEVAGISEFSAMVHAARGKKPILAYADGQMCSAAYWIASAADEIIANDTAMIGSIGVVCAVPHPGTTSARQVKFISSQSPKKQVDPTTDLGRSTMQGMVDSLADVFVSTVARNRGVSGETVLSDFGQGGVMIGKEAIDAGLADRLGSFEGIVAELANGRWRKPRRSMSASNSEESMSEKSLRDRIMNALGYSALRSSFAAGGIIPKPGPIQEPCLMEFKETTCAEAAESMAESKAKLIANHGETAVEIAGEALETDESVTWEKLDAQLAERTAIAAEREEKEKLKAELVQMRQAQFEKDAAAFVSAQIRSNKIMPAESEAIKELYLQAVNDDLVMPLANGSRLATFSASVDARPSHILTTQMVVGPTDKVLKSGENSQTGDMTEERRQELLSMTAPGRAAALRVVKS